MMLISVRANWHLSMPLSPPPHICKLKLCPIKQKLHVSLARVADYNRYKLNEQTGISWAYRLYS